MKTQKVILIILVLVAIQMTCNFVWWPQGIVFAEGVSDFFRWKVTGYNQAKMDTDEEQNEKDKQEIIRLSQDILKRFNRVAEYECIQKQFGIREWCDVSWTATMDNVLEFVYWPKDFQ